LFESNGRVFFKKTLWFCKSLQILQFCSCHIFYKERASFTMMQVVNWWRRPAGLELDGLDGRRRGRVKRTPDLVGRHQ
jgi:hypothetical protein